MPPLEIVDHEPWLWNPSRLSSLAEMLSLMTDNPSGHGLLGGFLDRLVDGKEQWVYLCMGRFCQCRTSAPEPGTKGHNPGSHWPSWDPVGRCVWEWSPRSDSSQGSLLWGEDEQRRCSNGCDSPQQKVLESLTLCIHMRLPPGRLSFLWGPLSWLDEVAQMGGLPGDGELLEDPRLGPGTWMEGVGETCP